LKTIKVFHNHTHFIIGLLQKTKEMFFNVSKLNVEFAPPTTHMHLYFNHKNFQHQNNFIKKTAHEIKKLQ